MMCKFLAQPLRNHTLALNYCMGAIDSKGVAHDEVTLIYGAPDDFDQVVGSLTFTERYKSFVASWSEGDAPDAPQLETFVADFQRLCFGDLDPNRFCWVGFLHRKGDKVDFHALIANVELTTGRHFNAAPPRWQFGFDALRDMHNARAGWASPADPRLARAVQPGSKPHFKAARTKKGLDTAPDTKSMLAMMVVDLVERGQISSREALIEKLATYGHIKRVRKDSITVVPEGMTEGVRLKGAMFAEGFDFSAELNAGPRPPRSAKDHDADRDPVAEEDARQRFEAAIKKRQTDNEHRYAPRKIRAKKNEAVATDAQTVSVPFEPVDLSGQVDHTAGLGSVQKVIDPQPSDLGRITPPQLGALVTIEDENHERFDRPAFSRVVAKLVLDLRGRFEQIASRIREFGENIRRERWLHAARFRLDRETGDDLGAADAGAVHSELEEVNPKPFSRSRP